MQTQTYEVKPGDTLSQIAQRLGVPQQQLTGYRSGDPNKIFPGEVLTVGQAPAAQSQPGGFEYMEGDIRTDPITGKRTMLSPIAEEGWVPVEQRGGEALQEEHRARILDRDPTYQAYASEMGYPVQTPAGPGTAGPGTAGPGTVSPGTDTGTTQTRTVIQELQDEIKKAQDAREAARANLENSRINLFNQEYAEQGLEETKEQIKSIDDQIAQRRAERDSAILTARRNPNISAGVLAGEVGKITDYYNSVINNEIQKRNAVATQYNTKLEEIDRKIRYQLGDLETEYSHWDKVMQEATKNLQGYESAVRDELKEQAAQERWEAEMAQQLAIAQMGAKDQGVRLTPITDAISGEIIGWGNPYTGEVFEPTPTGSRVGGVPTTPYTPTTPQSSTTGIPEDTEPEPQKRGFFQTISDWFRGIERG